MSPRIRITWFPKQNRGVIDCLFRLRGRDDIHASFNSDNWYDAVKWLDLGVRATADIGDTISVMLIEDESLDWVSKTESIVVELKVGE